MLKQRQEARLKELQVAESRFKEVKAKKPFFQRVEEKYKEEHKENAKSSLAELPEIERYQRRKNFKI